MTWPLLVLAHATSTGLATLDVAGTSLLYRLTVVATEVDDQAGRLLWLAGEGDQAAAARVAGFLRNYVRVSIAGEPCRPGRISIRGSSAADDKVVLEMALSCAKGTGTLRIRDDWPEVLGAHFQTVLSVRVPGRSSIEFAFLEDNRSATVDLAAPTPPSWTGFIAMGLEHILGGIDHLLFLLALLAFARGLWPTVKIVTAFTVAHSLTLSLAALGLADVPSGIIEPLIAASIVWVAVENLVAPAAVGRRWLVAALFGLVHGLGFASALGELDLGRAALVRALVGFNLGVELGQLAFVVVVLPPLAWASRPGRLPWLPRALSLAVAVAGTVWLVLRIYYFMNH
ncbi:MAG: HupE/UreJ family protein [Alphaproteobacteria bacterium]|nr:HupE/UreJ family protein [Alphaproteobacteria bacterium]